MWFKSVILLCAIVFTSADHWGYIKEQKNGKIEGEEDWGGQCAMGRRQSPIDLAEEVAVVGRYPSLMFTNYTEPMLSGRVLNTGHSIQIIFSPDQKYIMTGGGLPGTYIMDQMHFHWSSEHTINDERFGLELHIVSHEERFGNFSEAVKHKNGIAVLGVLFYVTENLNKDLKNILDSAEPVMHQAGLSSLLKGEFIPNDFIPKNHETFFRYEGSLTTPSCDESVIWTVLVEPIPFAMSQIERFKDLKDTEGHDVPNNYRTLQWVNSRPLVHVKGSDYNGSATFITPTSLFTTIISLIFIQIYKYLA